jgi:hypothetical protein
MSKGIRLSASKIKTLESCPWKYWATYHLLLPRSSNSGAARGTVCHLVLEVLLNSRHRHYIKKIQKAKTIEKFPSISRLVKKKLIQLGYYDEDNHLMCDNMILVALNCDFLGKKGGEVNEPEKEFFLENDNPEYKILGFMDKPVEYKKDKKVVIVDYKTSKQKFTEFECEFNVQALSYILAARKVWPDIKEASIEFQFLKFPEQPIVEVTATDDEIKGFEKWLSFIYKKVKKFTEPNANDTSNFAKFQPRPKKNEGFKGPLLCGFAKYPGQLKKDGNPMWHCEHKFAYNYYLLVNDDGESIKTAMTKEELDGSKGKIIKMRYSGCPAHPQEFNLLGGESQEVDPPQIDDFGF